MAFGALIKAPSLQANREAQDPSKVTSNDKPEEKKTEDFWKTPLGIFVIILLVLLPFIALAFRYAWKYPYNPKGTATGTVTHGSA